MCKGVRWVVVLEYVSSNAFIRWGVGGGKYAGRGLGVHCYADMTPERGSAGGNVNRNFLLPQTTSSAASPMCKDRFVADEWDAAVKRCVT